MNLLAALLLLDAILHAAVIYRFGTADKANVPFAVYIAVYAVLALLVFQGVRYSVVATLVLCLIGIVGLTVAFNAPKRADKTLDKAIWAVDLLIALTAAYLMFAA